MEVVVIEHIRVVRGVETYKRPPSRVAGKIVLRLPRRIGIPVNECGFQSGLRQLKGSSVSQLISGSHVVHHLCETFSSPVGVSTERTTCCIVGTETAQTVCTIPREGVGRQWKERQHTMHRIGNGKVISLRQTKCAARRLIGRCLPREVRGRVVVVVRQETL